MLNSTRDSSEWRFMAASLARAGVNPVHPCWVTPPPPPRSDHRPMTAYEISVKGHVSDALLADLDGLEAHERPAMTVLRSDIEGAAALRELLDRLSDRGLELIDVRQVEPGG
jgi:hypothetical protein